MEEFGIADSLLVLPNYSELFLLCLDKISKLKNYNKCLIKLYKYENNRDRVQKKDTEG